MNATFSKVNEILKTLPIGYYLGRNIAVKLDDTKSSFFDQMNDEIHIGYKMIANVCTTSIDTEDDIRTLLYHEVSHAMLTPSSLKMNFATNVFEDERIESLLRNCYMNVDFLEFCKRVNHYDPSSINSADSMFYYIVRFRHGPQKFVSRVHSIICAYSIVSCQSDFDLVINYYYEIMRLYEDVCREFSKQTSSNSSNASDASTKDSNNIDSNASTNNDSSRQSECLANPAKRLKHYSSVFINVKMQDDIAKILQMFKSSEKTNGSAINAYSGRFDYRSAARQDYKFFVQQNRFGNVKQFSKIHMNLFVDCSGSFISSKLTVNQLLHALTLLEKQNTDFSFDLITCGKGQTIQTKNKRRLECHGSNDLDSKIFDQFRSLQKPSSINVNIVLFDGDVASSFVKYSSDWMKCRKNFAAFNKSNVVIISDVDNKDAIEKYATSAKIKITKDYAKELYSEVINALHILSR